MKSEVKLEKVEEKAEEKKEQQKPAVVSSPPCVADLLRVYRDRVMLAIAKSCKPSPFLSVNVENLEQVVPVCALLHGSFCLACAVDHPRGRASGPRSGAADSL